MLVNMDDPRSMLWSKQRSTISSLAMAPRLAPEWRRLFFLIAVSIIPIPTLEGAYVEVDALVAFSLHLSDPRGALQSWEGFMMHPCTWFHVTCDAENRVVRLDLGNAGLSGPLAPELGLLPNLQYLELYMNNLSGPIPKELGNLTALVSLDLYENSLTGPIPDTFGQLSNLRFLRLNNNSLSGPIPVSLTAIEGLQVLDLSYNNLSGEIPSNGTSFPLFTPISFVGNDLLCGPVVGKPCPGQPAFSPPPNTPASPQTQEPKNRTVIVLASTISAAVFILVIAGFTFIICRNPIHSGHRQRDSKVADVEARKV